MKFTAVKHPSLAIWLATALTCGLSTVSTAKTAPAAGPIGGFPGGTYWLGVAYYPEQWAPARWDADFGQMHALGFNAVRMGEFAWAAFEPEEGKFDFGWMDQAIAIARSHGLAVILGTPTAAVPPWLYREHPEVLDGNRRGAFDYGGRQGYAVDDAAMRAAAGRLDTAMARHYADNPGVVAWQISNEPGFPFENFGPSSRTAFQRWLRARYGTIERLNAAWGGAFWSNRFDRWDEIGFPLNPAEGGWRPESWLDYRRFFSDHFIDWVGFERGVLRRYCRQPLYVNWPDTRWSVNTFRAASLTDLAAWDNYTPMPGPGDYHAQFYAGMNDDLSRCAHPNRRFIVSEQAAAAPTNSDPRAIRLQTYIGLAHGASGSSFFEWRPPLAGNEQAWPSVLQLDGSPGPAKIRYVQMAAEFARLGPLLDRAVTHSDLGMIFSYDNQWDQGFWRNKTFQNDEGYDADFQRFYDGLKRLQRNIDVIPPTAALEGYRVLVAPNLQILSDEVADRLNAFVRQGGILVLGPGSGTRDTNGRMREQVPPGVFAAVAGILIPSAGDLRYGGLYRMTMGSDGHGYPVATTMAGIELRGAEVLATFHGKGMEGKPAVTIHPYGRGQLVFVGGDTHEVGFYDELFSYLGMRFRIAPLLAVPDGVEVVSRHLQGRELLFVLNLTAGPQKIVLRRTYDDLVSQRRLGGLWVLPPFGVAILNSEDE